MQIVIALANRVLTPQQLARLLPDVAQTTLYRHINLLLEGGVLKVVRESAVRGTTERELTLLKNAGRIDLQTAATLLAEFRRSQQQTHGEMPPAFYSRRRLYLTPDELEEVNQQIAALLAAYQDPARRPDTEAVEPWTFTGVMLPDTQVPPTEEEKSDETSV